MQDTSDSSFPITEDIIKKKCVVTESMAFNGKIQVKQNIARGVNYKSQVY